MLAGHSKGGGQAQYVAVHQSLSAAVFNSDVVNPVFYTDPITTPSLSSIIDRFLQLFFQSYTLCRQGQFNDELRPYAQYLTSGKGRDIRMVNDPLIAKLYMYCGNNLPHAPIEWIGNTLACSNEGHAIETVVRELRVCSDTTP